MPKSRKTCVVMEIHWKMDGLMYITRYSVMAIKDSPIHFKLRRQGRRPAD